MLTSEFFYKQLTFNYLYKYIYVLSIFASIIFKDAFTNFILFLPNLRVPLLNMVALKKKNVFRNSSLKIKHKAHQALLQSLQLPLLEDAFSFPKKIIKKNYFAQSYYNNRHNLIKDHTNADFMLDDCTDTFNVTYCMDNGIPFILNFYEFFNENLILPNTEKCFFKISIDNFYEDLYYNSTAKCYPKKLKLKSTFMPNWSWNLPRFVHEFKKKVSFFKSKRLPISKLTTAKATSSAQFVKQYKKVSLNFKYRYNYIYKSIRRNFFLKWTLNNKTISYFLRLKKQKLEDNLNRFFNISTVLNFFFISTVQHKLIIGANCIYINGSCNLNKNKRLNQFDIIQLPISLSILNFFIYCSVFNNSLLKKLILKASHKKKFFKKKNILMSKQICVQNWVALDYLSMSCVILKVPSYFNFFRVNALNIFFYKSYVWKN